MRLCKAYPSHLTLAFRRNPASDQGAVLASTFSAFAPSSIAVIEREYFDLDYRSEYSATHETAFKHRNPNTVRVHFFGRSRPDTPKSSAGTCVLRIFERATEEPA